MTERRVRLSVESLEDRSTPATAADLVAAAGQTYANAWYLTQLNANRWLLTNPAIRPTVQALFTNVYQNATRTTALLAEFPGALPPATAALVGRQAAFEATVAQWWGSALGFPLVAAPTTPPPPTTPTPTPAPGPISPAKSTVAVNPASVAVGGTSTITLTAKDASGTPLTTGGATVAFALGTGTATGTIGGVTDNHNGTYTATFTATGAGTRTITATIGTQDVTTAAPTLTVTSGTAASPATSTVAVNPASVAVGGTSTVTLTAKDASGTPLTTGGATVVFGLGAGTTIGTFGQVTDNHDGTYTATFTGSAAGSNTVTATINNQAVTTTAPGLTVTAAPTPGAVSPATSTVAVSPASVAIGGTSTVTLTAKDASGTPLATGGAAVQFGLGAGTTIGAFGNVTDNNNGTYTATFTGGTAGSNTVTATINNQPVTTTAPALTVTATATPGTASPATSVLSITPATIPNGTTATVTLTAKDASGTALTTGGAAVAFGLGGGTGQGTFTDAVDNHNGTYTATFTATGIGGNTLTATLDGVAVTSGAPSLTVS